MKAAVITYPGSNCDRDLAQAFAAAGADVTRVWHKQDTLPDGVDIVGIPGGFSFGDYLRCGAIAARAPIAGAIRDFAARGGHVLGICNGFQVLVEMGLLPGALLRNAGLRYICKPVGLTVEAADTPFTASWAQGQVLSIPIAHHDGNYTADAATLDRLDGEGRVAFRYMDNPNGSARNIAGVLSENRRVLGMMPHPERAIGGAGAGDDGRAMFTALLGAFAPA